jgi:hypothetical protein
LSNEFTIAKISMKLNIDVNIFIRESKSLILKPIKKKLHLGTTNINDFQEIKTKQYRSILLARNKCSHSVLEHDAFIQV